MSTVSWIASRASRPQTIKVRQDYREAYAGERDAAGRLVTDERGIAVDPPRPARLAWPAETYLRVKAIPSGADIKKVSRLQMSKPQLRANASGEAGIEAEMDIPYPALVYAAVYLESLHCPPGGVFTDPDTCETDPETGEPILETGRVFTLPRSTSENYEERMAAAAALPAQVLSFLLDEIVEQVLGPLPGTATPTTEASSNGESGPASTRPSRRASPKNT